MAGKPKTTERFISDAIKVHGDKYDYSLVEYENAESPVVIICKICGSRFSQTPHTHLKGRGCAICGINKRKSLVCGVGVNDTYLGRSDKAYSFWKSMIERCYSKLPFSKYYHNCKVCDEWLLFSNFSYWFHNNYIEGYELDKDILTNGMGYIYSPETCVFVPSYINTLVAKCGGKDIKGYSKTPEGKFTSKIRTKDGVRRLGVFKTKEEAFSAYKTERERYIKEIADEYYNKGLISDLVHKAMYNFSIIK